MRFIGVEVEQETSAPPPKKILDPPLLYSNVQKMNAGTSHKQNCNCNKDNVFRLCRPKKSRIL